MSSLAARLPIAAATGAVALIVAAIAVWFLGQSLFLLLVQDGFTPAAAAGLTGFGGLVLAGLIGAVARQVLRPRASSAAAMPAAAAGTSGVNGIAVDLGALVAQQLATSARAHPYGTIGTALAAGLAVGALPELRKTLLDLLKH